MMLIVNDDNYSDDYKYDISKKSDATDNDNDDIRDEVNDYIKDNTDTAFLFAHRNNLRQ